MQLDSRLAVDSAPRHEIITQRVWLNTLQMNLGESWPRRRSRVSSPPPAPPPRGPLPNAGVLLASSSGKVGTRLNR